MTIAGAIMICTFGFMPPSPLCTTFNKQFETIEECEFEANYIKKELVIRQEFEVIEFSCVDTSK